MSGQAIWLEAPRGGYPDATAASLLGIDRARAWLNGEIPLPPMARLTGLQLVEVGAGTATFNLPASNWLLWNTGGFGAGAFALAADAALGAALLTTLPAKVGLTTSECSLSFLRQAQPGTTFVARGRTVHAARSTGLSEVFIEDPRGRLLAHGSSRCVFVPIPDDVPTRPSCAGNGETTPDPYQRQDVGRGLPQEFYDQTPGSAVVRRYIAGELPRHPLAQLTGLNIVEGEGGKATVSLPATEWLCNSNGHIYGGFIELLADAATSTALGSTFETPGIAIATLDLKTYFLRPVPPDGRDMTARAEVVQRGRTIALANCRVTNADARPWRWPRAIR